MEESMDFPNYENVVNEQEEEGVGQEMQPLPSHATHKEAFTTFQCWTP
jgi:hypothetical protein